MIDQYLEPPAENETEISINCSEEEYEYEKHLYELAALEDM